MAATASLLLADFFGFSASSSLSSSEFTFCCLHLFIVDGVSFCPCWRLVIVVGALVIVAVLSLSAVAFLLVAASVGFCASLLLSPSPFCRHCCLISSDCVFFRRRRILVVLLSVSLSTSASASCCRCCIVHSGGGVTPCGCFPRIQRVIVVIVGVLSSSLAMCCSRWRRRPFSRMLLSASAPCCCDCWRIFVVVCIYLLLAASLCRCCPWLLVVVVDV